MPLAKAGILGDRCCRIGNPVSNIWMIPLALIREFQQAPSLLRIIYLGPGKAEPMRLVYFLTQCSLRPANQELARIARQGKYSRSQSCNSS